MTVHVDLRTAGAGSFLKRAARCDLTVAVIGLGYVGLPLLLRLKACGFATIGLDADAGRIGLLGKGRSPIGHIADRTVAALATDPKCLLTTDFSRVGDADAIIVCVPTPLTAHRTPDMAYVAAVADSIRPYLRRGHLVVLESTVYPGATEEYFLPAFASAGLTVGEDAYLAYSPEREDPGNKAFSTHNIPKVCGGMTPECLRRAIAVYRQVTTRVVEVSSVRTAEMTKLLENIHRSVNIGLVNEMKIIADRMGINIHEVIDAAATKPFGFTPYRPGPGLGGHCIPIDPFYMTWKAREYGIDTKFIELAGQINAGMPDYVVGKVQGALNAIGRAPSGSRVLVCGLAYKPDIDDVRESPAITIVERLLALGATVDCDDRHVSLDAHEVPAAARRVRCEEVDLPGYDCVVLVTDHAYFDYPRLLAEARTLVDTRGRYEADAANLYRA